MYAEVVARNSEFSTQLEHHERILLYLLSTSDTTIYDVMRDCYLSESVIKASLKRLEPQFEDHSLHLSVKGSTIHLDGDEALPTPSFMKSRFISVISWEAS